MCLLFLAPATYADVVFSGALGLDIKNIKDPGATISFGYRDNLNESGSHVVTGFFNSVNFGNSLDNVGVMATQFWIFTPTWSFGTREAGDYEPDDGNLNGTLGVELLRKGKILFFADHEDIDTFVYADALYKKELQSWYFQFGIGIIK